MDRLMYIILKGICSHQKNIGILHIASTYSSMKKLTMYNYLLPETIQLAPQI